MVVTETVPAETDTLDRLIARYIDRDARGGDAEEARVRDAGYAVWAIVGDLLPPGRTAEVVAKEYRVPVAAVEAVWAYYLRHRAAIDRRLEENRAG